MMEDVDLVYRVQQLTTKFTKQQENLTKIEAERAETLQAKKVWGDLNKVCT